MTNLKIILPRGATGAHPGDTILDTFLRAVGAKHGNPAEWPEKYGADYRDEKVVMHTFCWCEKEDCPYCLFPDEDGNDSVPTEAMIREFGIDLSQDEVAPNFWYKPLDYKVWWYKYIGRSMKANRILSGDEWAAMVKDCLGE